MTNIRCNGWKALGSADPSSMELRGAAVKTRATQTTRELPSNWGYQTTRTTQTIITIHTTVTFQTTRDIEK
jgi:hypothetical protein